MAKMSAAQYDRYGPPEVLHAAPVDAPSPKPGEVLIRVRAASVNGIDVIVRSGVLKLFTGRKFPRGTGLDFAGEIAKLGAGSQGFAVGDRVWGALRHGQGGSIAEFVCCKPDQVSLIPVGVDITQAAALPAVGVTAITALQEIGNLKAGQRLLVRGASGGVGSIAVQLGHALGAHVTGLASAKNLGFVRELGADAALDYATVKPQTLGHFDVILDTVGSQTRAYRRLLAPGGRMTTLCPDPARPLSSMLYSFVSRIHGGRRVRFFSAKPDTGNLTQLADYVSSGAIRPIVDTVYPLPRIADAHRAMEAGGRRGKQVIEIA